MDSKVVFITHPYYAVNNPDNNLRIYKKNRKKTFLFRLIYIFLHSTNQ